MTFEEAENLKKSLNSDTYRSLNGNELQILVVPAEAEGMKIYQSALQWNWDTIKDNVARRYTLKEQFILYGIRKMKNGKFAGGPLNLEEHPELLMKKKN